MIRSKTAVLARDVVGSISIQRELREVMRFMTKSVIERMLDDEETMRGLSGLPQHERRLPGFDNKNLALYAKGMSTSRDYS